MGHGFQKRIAFALPAMATACCAFAYDPPLGIPAPSFGIDEQIGIYAGMAGYQDAGNGPYTLYVDNTALNCTNSGAATAIEPLCDLPTTLNAGAVVEVHGGPYTDTDVEITANGTVTQPVFIRGVNDGSGNPVIYDADVITFFGTYFIVEHFNLDRTRLKFGDGGQPVNYASARHLHVHHHPDKNGSSFTGDNVVLWSSEIDHNQGDDRHGTFIAPGSENVWILDNHYHHNGGDAIQFCHACTVDPPDTIFIGRNLMHSDRENAVDLKYAKNIVISQNTMHSYADAEPDELWCFDDGSLCATYSSGSDGSAIVIGSDGASENVWAIANTVYGSNRAVRVEKAESTLNIIGNLFYDLDSSAILFEKRAKPVNIILNTFYDVNRAISQDFRPTFDAVIKDNIFLESHDATIYFDDRDVTDAAVLDSNIFWNSDGIIDLRWRNAKTVTTGAEINALSGNCKLDNTVIDPQLDNPALNLFSPTQTSTAIDAASNSLVTFDQVYRGTIPGGTSIMKDIDGNLRTAGAIEIGAIEYVPQP